MAPDAVGYGSSQPDPIMSTATIASIASQVAMAAIAALNTRPSTISGAHAQGAAIKGGCKSIAKLATIAAASDSLQLRLHLDSLQTAVLDAADDPHWNYDTIATWLYS